MRLEAQGLLTARSEAEPPAGRAGGILLAVLVLGEALSVLFAPARILALRAQRKGVVVEFLGGRLPGDHVHRFVPLMQATPAWQLALWVLTGMALLAVLWRLGRGRDAFALGALAVVLCYAGSFAAWLDRLRDPALAQA